MRVRGIKERVQVLNVVTRVDKRARRVEEVQEEAEGDVRQDRRGQAYQEDHKGVDLASEQTVAKGQRQVAIKETPATKVSPRATIKR